MTTAITRRADRYLEMLMEAAQKEGGRLDESELLECFEDYVNDILDRYIPPGPRVRGSLVFNRIYGAVGNPPAGNARDGNAPDGNAPDGNVTDGNVTDGNVTDGESRRQLVVALIAAETEHRGPLRLTQAQTARLADVFERIGQGLSAERLPGHAALAFDRASLAYLQVGDHASRDRCLYARACAVHRTRRRGVGKALEAVSGALSGYGFRPYRMLGWILVQLVVFSVALNLLSRESVERNVYMVLINYFNLLGVGDTGGLPRPAWVLLIVEGYTGAVTTSVFFALLVRRWFRI